jgi:acetoin utilization protein AcuC
MARRRPNTVLVAGEKIARYGFGEGHPFGPDRHDAFIRELKAEELDSVLHLLEPRTATREEIEAFHTPAYVSLVEDRSLHGQGFLDAGDTPAFRGVFEAASNVVGAALVATEAIMDGRYRRGFVPIAGLHHASRSHAAGFCVFNDAGVVAELLRRRWGLQRVAYVDIDAHHGDGVFYGFEDDPGLIFADIHEDGRYLYPGTGAAEERGRGAAHGTKLNIPLPPDAGDDLFYPAWDRVEAFLEAQRPEFIVLQCGADSLEGDPITHLRFTEEAHAHAAARLAALADRICHGRVLGLGGGGYNRRNLARAWTRVVRSFLETGA